MGRRKIEIKAIKDDRNRSVTFLKRKGGLFKKAHELSVLCSVDVAVIIFGHNKKLYEYSSGDIQETIGRYQYYGGPHEHKGPADFNSGNMDDDDEDDMGSPPLEDPMPREHSLPPHLQNPSSYMRTASPPITNGVQYPQRQHTPQAQMISRPGSRNSGVSNVRRSSTNLGPSHLQQVSQAPQGQNGYAYMQTPPMHNYQAAHGMPVAPHHSQQSTPQPQYYRQPPPQPPVTRPQMHQVYMEDPQRRQSLPPAFPQHEHHQQQQQRLPSPPQPDRQHQTQDDQSNRLQKPAPAKSRSIFTPIDDSRSMLAQHWGIGKSSNEPKPEIKRERDVEAEAPPNQVQKPTPPPAKPQNESPAPKRSESSEFPPPSRASTAQSNAKRPRLKVQIPEEQSDADSATAESSPQQSGATPAKANTEASHSSGTGVVLPPPSPSASAILSAGASGPPNPFARPHPPSQQNAQSYNANNNIDTPMSALPSRFVADGLLPSPSTFYPGWDFGRSGGDSNMLPSPLNFPTPVMGGPSFRDEDGERKRKSPEQEGNENAKRVKT
ncbi:resistance to lethality of mkk1p386 overexpression [Lecanora helva]